MQQGNQTLDQALRTLVDRGDVALEDALIFASDPQKFAGVSAP